jgi:two-component system, response regulator, stage 0 sporulation protein F
MLSPERRVARVPASLTPSERRTKVGNSQGAAMPKILVVDDEVNVRKLYKKELEDEGHEVVTAANGAEALQVIAGTTPDLVILDIKLETENGLDLLRRMKEVQPALAVILNSGYSTYRDDFSSWLADAYLVKSSNTTELTSVVREVLVAREVR